jgi:hypothetical protein
MVGKNKKLADVGKALVSPTVLTYTDLESKTGLRGEKWRLATCTAARPVVAINARTHARTHTHARAHAHTHPHAHPHTHTHTYIHVHLKSRK